MGQVLLVDDNPTQLRIRETILRSAGFTVHIATTVDSALAFMRISGDQVSLVVTDHYLPGRTGVDLVRELRQTRPDMPVVVLSGMPDIDEEYEGLNVRIRQKPFPPEELIRVVESSIQNRSTK